MRKKILIVNANRGMIFLLQTVLSPLYNIIVVNDVFEGVSALKRNRNIEVFIVDADIKPAECIDFISHVQGSWLYRCPGIILTNNKDLASTIVSSNEECIAYCKPFNPKSLLSSINALVSPSPVLA